MKPNVARIRAKALPKLSLCQLFMLTLPFAGLQFEWALQTANASAYLLELGMEKSSISVVWLAGPFAGIIVQPLVGAMSDRSNFSYGKRRVFIIVGALLTIVTTLLFASAKTLGEFFGDNGESRVNARRFAVVAFWAADFSMNAVMAPLRALLSDSAPPSQQALGNSMFSVMIALGNILGYALGSIKLTQSMPMFATDLQGLYFVGACFLFVCTLFVLFVAEKPAEPDSEHNLDIEVAGEVPEQDQERESLINPTPVNNTTLPSRPRIRVIRRGAASELSCRIWDQIFNFPKSLRRVWLAQMLSWFAWFCLFIYGTAWIAMHVYHGDPTAKEGTVELDNYREGVRAGNQAFLAQAWVALVYSLLLPGLIRAFGYKANWFFALVLQAICLFLTSVWDTPTGVLVLFGAQGASWAVLVVVPWALVAIASTNSNHKGLILSVLNISACIPQILASLTSLILLGPAEASISFVLAVGGMFALTSALMALTIPFHQIVGGQVDEPEYSVDDQHSIRPELDTEIDSEYL